jgi:CubicO group peptidase (beta-lactamase class C family)
MQLVEEGTLSLDDPVSKYGVQLESPGIIRVKHLLSMTSDGNPGEGYQYNGYRYSLLGQVIEGASGRTFHSLDNPYTR